MKNQKYKTAIIVLAALIGLCVLTMVGLIVGRYILEVYMPENADWYGIIIGPFLVLMIYMLMPLYVAIGYEGMGMSAFSPAQTTFWFWLALLVCLGCSIALAVISKKYKTATNNAPKN